MSTYSKKKRTVYITAAKLEALINTGQIVVGAEYVVVDDNYRLISSPEGLSNLIKLDDPIVDGNDNHIQLTGEIVDGKYVISANLLLPEGGINDGANLLREAQTGQGPGLGVFSKDIELIVEQAVDNKDAHNIGFDGDGTNYLVSKTDVESAIKELDTRVKANVDGKQDKLTAGDNISIVGNTISASGGSGITDAPSDDKLYGRKNSTWEEVQGGEVDLNAMSYFDYAGSIYGAKYSLLANAWESSLTVDTGEISQDSTTSLSRGLAQYPDSETEGIIIPHGVTGIGNNAFRSSINNMPLVIPGSVTSIGTNTFMSWSSNNQPLVIPNSITIIGQAAFYGWASNNYPLVIPSSITSIGNSTFQNWTSNNHPLVIPSSITSIGQQAFMDWSSNNKPLVIPSSVTSIGNNAFQGWSSNNQPLVIPNSITMINHQVFMNWSSNNHLLVIPGSVTSIGNNAFRGWSANNQPLVIPNSVSSIGNQAFQDWTNVPYIEMKSTTPPLLSSSGSFDNQNNAPIYVPDASVTAYKTATNWTALASRIFPVSEKDIPISGGGFNFEVETTSNSLVTPANGKHYMVTNGDAYVYLDQVPLVIGLRCRITNISSSVIGFGAFTSNQYISKYGVGVTPNGIPVGGTIEVVVVDTYYVEWGMPDFAVCAIWGDFVETP